MSLTEFFEYLITHEETRELGSDLVHTYYDRIDLDVDDAEDPIARSA